MLRRLTILPFALALSFIFQSACLAQFAIGERVDASPSGLNWYGATVSGTVQGGFVVKMDGGNGYKQGEEYVVPITRIRANTIAPPASAPAAGSDKSSLPGANTNNTNSSTANSGAGDCEHPKNSNIKWTTNYTKPGETGPINSGKGKPPDGTYHCVMWTAGMMINLGDLEIHGNTYRGLNTSKGFHSYVVDPNDNMTLSSGLNGMPAGFTLKSLGWVGSNSQGRPMIKIGFIGKK